MLDSLSTFDGIIGHDLLQQASVELHLKTGELRIASNFEKLQYHKCASVNLTKAVNIDASPLVKEQFLQMLKTRDRGFADPDEALPYNTSVVATIRSNDYTPVYCKLYPYPMGVAEVKSLLKDNIIRKSRSPYNNPMWVVNKKGTNEFGNRKKRMFIDFRKLNSKTVADKYPMPNISTILSNLGRAKFFKTLDLKSEYHQITLAERDREKTSFSVNGGKYEFCRLPFGLKNAGSIFQRAIDDVVREQIGKICYVYVDDVIIFSKS